MVESDLVQYAHDLYSKMAYNPVTKKAVSNLLSSEIGLVGVASYVAGVGIHSFKEVIDLGETLGTIPEDLVNKYWDIIDK